MKKLNLSTMTKPIFLPRDVLIIDVVDDNGNKNYSIESQVDIYDCINKTLYLDTNDPNTAKLYDTIRIKSKMESLNVVDGVRGIQLRWLKEPYYSLVLYRNKSDDGPGADDSDLSEIMRMKAEEMERIVAEGAKSSMKRLTVRLSKL